MVQILVFAVTWNMDLVLSTLIYPMRITSDLEELAVGDIGGTRSPASEQVEVIVSVIALLLLLFENKCTRTKV